MRQSSAEEIQEIACQQILEQDASVYSVQWLVLPESCAPRVTAEFLLDRYLKLVRNWTWSLIRPALSAEGVQFRILNTPLVLLSFGPAEYPGGEGAGEVHLRVNGGLLVQPRECDRGLFSLYAEEVAEGVRVRVQLSDYCPLLLGSARPSRLRRLLYRVTQAYLHKVVTVRYLAELYRELTGEKPNPRVLQVKVREGKET
jgi:hypothetical protein